MVRKVEKDDWKVSRASKAFGFSRVRFYELQKALEKHGLAEVMGFVEEQTSKEHLERNVYLYVRQSTIRQVFENTESTKRASKR